MTNPDRSKQLFPDSQLLEPAGLADDEMDVEVERIRRLGKRLFNVANCVTTLGHADLVEAGDAEAVFCRSVAPQEEVLIVSDLRSDRSLSQHSNVAGAPYLRFFASHPVRNGEGKPVGAITLLDYQPRVFSGEDRVLLADLAALVERELHVKSMNALQFDLRRKNKNLRRKSLIDPLLGTWNRGAIMRILNLEIARCDKIGLPLSVIVADIDHFKKINDTCGHPAGDTALVKVASRLRSCIRPQEALGRYGGEEFLVVLPGSSITTALAVAERMREAIAAQPETIGDVSRKLTISAGVASTDLFPTASTEELISRADAALYAAKDAGRNRVARARSDLP